MWSASDWKIWIQLLKSGYLICSKTRNPNNALSEICSEICPWVCFLLVFFWEIRKRILKTVLCKNSGLAHAHSMQILFSNFPIKPSGKEGEPLNPDSDVLVEIHLEGAFLKVEIRFQILRVIVKSEILISKSRFPNRTHS